VAERSPASPRTVAWAAALALLCVACSRPLPDDVRYAGTPTEIREIAFLYDQTWVDSAGERHVQQEIFDEMLAMIAAAERLILIDMFLYNDFQGPIPETTRALSSELTAALIARKQRVPAIEIVVITDPVNTVYGGLPSPQLERLRQHDIRVVITDLNPLRDSSPVYSAFWRLLVRPFGNSPGGALPNPFGAGEVPLRSYLALFNFKANHRKVVIADSPDGYVGLVTSANPHDGSSAHRNAAIRFDGPAVADLLRTENAVLKFSDAALVSTDIAPNTADGGPTVQVVTEGEIERAVLRTLASARPGERVDLMMFYLSDRDVITALIAANDRGVDLRVLLDPNKDAFGLPKNGIPNRSVAWELNDARVPLRWCHTHGEQCHTKLLFHDDGEEAALITGSANFTRRNLNDFNLETDVVVSGSTQHEVFREAADYFDASWNNVDGRIYSVPYADYADESWIKRGLYRFMEASGFSSF
jgi:phosphatidylserine/phosphatidylglycerophosphate/cardiolipin synthase-like enzyme